MNTITDELKRQITRLKVLLMCSIMKETGANVGVMEMLLNTGYIPCSQFDIEAACYHLSDKGLIRFESSVPGEFNIETDRAFITAEGNEVLEALEMVADTALK